MRLERNKPVPTQPLPRMTLRPYQCSVLAQACQATHWNFWMDPGTGKTLTITEWLKWHHQRVRIDIVILVAPDVILSGWYDTLSSQFDSSQFLWLDCRAGSPDSKHLTTLFETGSCIHTGSHLTIMATTPGVIRSQLLQGTRINLTKLDRLKPYRVAYVCDESQSICGPESGQGRANRALASRCALVANSTGTPIGNPKHLRIYAHTALMKPTILVDRKVTGWTSFKARYAVTRDVSGRVVAGGPIVVDVNQDRIDAELLDPAKQWTSYLSIQSAQPELPEKIHRRITFDLPTTGIKLYRDLLKRDAVLLDETPVHLRSSVIKRLRCLEVCSGWITGDDGAYVPRGTWRLDALRGVLDESLESHPYCTIWAVRYVTFLACALVASGVAPETALAQACQACRPVEAGGVVPDLYQQIVMDCEAKGVGMLHGGTPADRRDDVIKRFKSGQFWCLVAHPKTGGAGLNLQHCHRGIVVEQPLGSIDRTQMEARHHRSGVTGEVTWFDLIAGDTLEPAILSAQMDHRDAEVEIMTRLGQGGVVTPS